MEFRFNGISERDMDLLFLEEFAINRDFLNLFLRKVQSIDFTSSVIISEEVSFVDTALGESDLTIVLENKGRRIALLIEDKINAIAQPRQYERYVERGRKGINENLYDAFYIFLIAPTDYIEGNDSAAKYPHKVTYEECQALFAACDDLRSNLKYRQISEAIKQGHRPYTKIVDGTSTLFWEHYVLYMQEHYPHIELKSKAREKSKRGDWPTYKTCLDLNAVYIHHKMQMKGVTYSNIDLTFNRLGAHREELKALLKEMLGDRYDSKFGIHRAGNSAVLRLVAAKCIDWQVPFEDQLEVVDEHLRLVSKLCEAAEQIDKKRLLEFYADKAPEKLK